MDRETGKCKGYGFCEYADSATALSAMRNLNGYDIGGRNLRVDFADGGEKAASGSGNTKAERKDKKKQQVTGGIDAAALQSAIDEAVETQGPIQLYDALVAFQEFGRSNPQHARIILEAHPALSQAIIQTFDMFDLPTEVVEKSPPRRNKSPTRRRSPPPAVGGEGILGEAPPVPVPILDKPRHRAAAPTLRDPRRRDPRKQQESNSELASIEAMARSMTAEKLQQLEPEERQMLMAYMDQMGIHLRNN